jgi:hypothetical protein
MSSCPSGYTLSSDNKCILQNSSLLDVVMKDLQTGYEYNGMTISGMNIKPQYKRGWHFDGSAYAALPSNLTYGVNFSFELWIRPDEVVSKSTLLSKYSDQDLIYLYIYKSNIYLKAFFSDISNSLNSSMESVILLEVSAKEWMNLGIQFSLNRGNTKISVYKNSKLENYHIVSEEYFSDDLSGSSFFTLGAYYRSPDDISQYFKGFIASFKTTNIKYSASHYSGNCVTSDFCLSDCGFGLFPSIQDCGECKEECEDGCSNGGNCSMNISPLCVKYTDFEACDECDQYSYLVNGVCNCVEGAIYDIDTNSCVCAAEYYPYKGKCVICRDYLYPSEVSGVYSSDYSSIVLSFHRRIKGALIRSCSDLLEGSSLQQIGSKSLCTPSMDRMSARIDLHGDSSFRAGLIHLNPVNIVGEGKICRLNPDPIELDIALHSMRPYLRAQIEAPSSYSLSCGSEPLILSASGSYGLRRMGISYRWNVYGDGVKDGISIEAEGEGYQYLVIQPEKLQPGVIYANLTFSNALGDQESTVKTIEIEESKQIGVGIDAGRYLMVTSLNSIRLQGIVNNRCGSEHDLEYNWSLLSPDSDSYTPLNHTKSLLIINPRTLEPGFTYTYLLEVDDNYNLTGYAEIIVDVEYPELVLFLNKVDSIISIHSDQVLDASGSYDPLGYNLTYSWVCSIEGRPCMTSDKELLVSNTSSIISIPSSFLSPDIIYNFEVEISTSDGRFKTKRVEFRTVDTHSNQISITPPSKVSHKEPLFINPLINAPEGAIIRWVQTSGPLITSLLQSSTPLLQLPSGVLLEGELYTLELEILYPDIIGLSTLVLNVNTGPKAGKFSVFPLEGKEFYTSFKISAESYYNIDEADYPLSYSFYYKLESGDIYKSRVEGYSYSYNSVLSSVVAGVGVVVCDSVPICIEEYIGVNVSKYTDRALQDDLSKSYISQVEDPDNIPGVSILYLTSYSLEIHQYKLIYDDFLEYMKTQPQNRASREVYYSFYKALLLQTDHISAEEVLQILNNCYSLINGKADISLDEADEIYDVIYPAISRYSNDVYFIPNAMEYLYNIFHKCSQHDGPSRFERKDSQRSYYQKRALARDLSQETVSISGMDVTFPDYIEEAGAILDIYISVIYNDTLPTFTLMVSKSGLYENHNVHLQSSKETASLSNFSSPFVFSFPWSRVYEESDIILCREYSVQEKAWISHECEAHVVDNRLEIQTSSFGLLRLEVDPGSSSVESDDECDVMVAPYVILGVWFCVLTFIWFIIINIKGYTDKAYELPSISSEYVDTQNGSYRPKQVEERAPYSAEEEANIMTVPPSPTHKPPKVPTANWSIRSYFKLHILIEIFRKDSKMYSMIHLFNFMVSQHLGFALLGTFIYAFTDSEDNSSDSIHEIADDNYPYDLRYIFMALAIVIPVSVPARFLVKLRNRVVDIVLLISSVSIFVGSMLGIVLMCSYFCQAATLRWTLAYMIFIPAELIISEFVISTMLFVAGKK